MQFETFFRMQEALVAQLAKFTTGGNSTQDNQVITPTQTPASTQR